MLRLPVILTMILFVSPSLFAESDLYSPKPIKKYIEYIIDENGKKLIAESEYQAVMAADFDAIVSVLSDLEGAKDLFPSVKESSLTADSGDLIKRRIKASYKLLGVGRSYSYIENVYFLENTADKFTLESVLVKSLDDELNGYRGYWHVERLPESKDGSARSIVSLYSYFDYKKPFFMQDKILGAFTDDQVADMFANLEKASKEK